MSNDKTTELLSEKPAGETIGIVGMAAGLTAGVIFTTIVEEELQIGLPRVGLLPIGVLAVTAAIPIGILAGGAAEAVAREIINTADDISSLIYDTHPLHDGLWL